MEMGSRVVGRQELSVVVPRGILNRGVPECAPDIDVVITGEFLVRSGRSIHCALERLQARRRWIGVLRVK